MACFADPYWIWRQGRTRRRAGEAGCSAPVPVAGGAAWRVSYAAFRRAPQGPVAARGATPALRTPQTLRWFSSPAPAWSSRSAHPG